MRACALDKLCMRDSARIVDSACVTRVAPRVSQTHMAHLFRILLLSPLLLFRILLLSLLLLFRILLLSLLLLSLLLTQMALCPHVTVVRFQALVSIFECCSQPMLVSKCTTHGLTILST